ncbi:sugar transferase [Parvularcula marina]|nr:sugar transferase [Parvularcula marina]
MVWLDAFVTVVLFLAAIAAGAMIVNHRLAAQSDSGAGSSVGEKSTQSPALVLQDTVSKAVSGQTGAADSAPEGWIDPLLYDREKTMKTPLVRKAFFSRFLKRSMDVLLSLMLIIFTAPLIIAVAILIKMDSRGPVFYQQARMGRDGKVFRILKFRTMRTNAEENGPRWAEKGDNRITKIGSFLRRSRIDEIPQAINILRGDMSFVGPRPERPEFSEKLAAEIPNFEARTLVKPGLTGWAQVNLPYAASVSDTRMKLAYDLYYIEKQSAWLDFLIVLKTFRVALFSDSAH